MKTDEILSILSMLKDKTGTIKEIMDDLAHFAEHVSEAAKIGKSIMQRIEEIKK